MPIPEEQAFTTGATEFGGTLEDRLRFETLLADLFARFVNVPADRLNREIGNAHRTICEALRIDHSSVWQITPDNPEEFVLIHLVRDPNLPPPPERMRGIDYFPWVQAKLEAKEVVIVEDTAKAPPEASTDLQSWQYFRLKSSLVFPLYVGSGPVLGVLSFDDTCRPRDYPEPLRNRLQLLAQVFASALDRERADQKLRDSEMRLSLAAASAGAGLWTIKVGDGRVWATEKARELYGVSSDQKLTFDFFLGLVHHEDRERVRGAVQDAIRTGDETAAEYRIVLQDGAVRWIAARGRRQSGQAGESDRLMGVSIDVTEAKRVEHEMAKLQERLQAESEYLQEEVRTHSGFDEIVGHDKQLKAVFQRIEQVANTDATVLITGETGTGKELVARAIHNLSRRKDRVMVKIDCSSLPGGLIESEMFGREKGAYTGALSKQIGRFELANGSTVFLDEIGELPLELQAKLLRILQDSQLERLGSPKTIKVDLRVIAATNRNLADCVKEGSFRQDLYYRLNVFPIQIPPLRERNGDIPLLTWAFVRDLERKLGKKIESIPKKAMEALQAYSWPGNVRELKNVVEQALIITDGSQLQVQMPGQQDAVTLPTLKGAEHRHILSVLERTGWRIKGPGGAAELLAMKPSTLYTTMQRLGIPTKRVKDGIPT